MKFGFVRPEDVRLRIKPRIPYREVLDMLSQGYVFLIQCDRRRAHDIAKRLDKKAKEMFGNVSVEYTQAEYCGEKCYAFYMLKTVEKEI